MDKNILLQYLLPMVPIHFRKLIVIYIYYLEIQELIDAMHKCLSEAYMTVPVCSTPPDFSSLLGNMDTSFLDNMKNLSNISDLFNNSASFGNIFSTDSSSRGPSKHTSSCKADISSEVDDIFKDYI